MWKKVPEGSECVEELSGAVMGRVKCYVKKRKPVEHRQFYTDWTMS